MRQGRGAQGRAGEEGGGMERTLRDVIERAEGMVGRGEGACGHVMMGRCEQARECYERFTGFCSNTGEWRKSLRGG